jgi:predicted DCC family thiol-disulfide oxidoreductase YuxK
VSGAPDPAVIVFDGLCNLCTSSVQFILQHEREPHFKFASLQSAGGASLLAANGLAPGDVDSFVLIEDGRSYTRSDAAIRVARALPAPWSLAAALFIIPRPIRDWAYRIIARNRYHWFGRRATCMVPSPGDRERFLE